MKIINENGFNKLIADEGKMIRDIHDEYKEAYIDSNGIEVPENIPYYTDTIYLAKNFNIDEIDKCYVEEVVNNE